MKRIFPVIIALCCTNVIWAQPKPGDLFKEYAWYNKPGDCQGALRVGGRLDYQLIENVQHYKGNGQIQPPFQVDLKNAFRAELIVEKMLCHGGTKGLRVSINGNKALRLPVSPNIPWPEEDYAHHYNAILPLDLSLLKEGTDNTFKFEVDTAGHWWPQNLIYGMILRIYYDSSLITEKTHISQPKKGDILEKIQQIQLHIPSGENIEKVHLVGFYEDVDLEGDGLYTQWHYAYHKGLIYNHIDSSSKAPYTLSWNTEWVPDQKEKMKLAAFIHRSDGYIYMSDAVENLQVGMRDYSVELCKPFRRPKHWFTRNGEFEERFYIDGNIEKASAARMFFRTWSPGYFNGIYINDFLVFTKEGPKYAYYEHNVPIKELHVLKEEENILKTGITPLYPEGMVHGVEVQWPGIMLLIKYSH